jgi:Ca2+-binding EF-hand superfamily protein
MDRDGDKLISKKELHSWILRSFRSLSQEESTERFKDADQDGDGHVTW